MRLALFPSGRAKSAYNAATGANDSVAPNFTKSNNDVGTLVDTAEELAKKGNERAVAQFGDVAVLGQPWPRSVDWPSRSLA